VVPTRIQKQLGDVRIANILELLIEDDAANVPNILGTSTSIALQAPEPVSERTLVRVFAVEDIRGNRGSQHGQSVDQGTAYQRALLLAQACEEFLRSAAMSHFAQEQREPCAEVGLNAFVKDYGHDGPDRGLADEKQLTLLGHKIEEPYRVMELGDVRPMPCVLCLEASLAGVVGLA
jgi:hypothetical protein